ncbi:hypothetical protein B0H11DRAFT_2283318 [Mycena galericulata]|nr:hypothetical protein B0H11DRAFT_2283318 [Mycena galericulata]
MEFPIELYSTAREMPPRIPQPSHRHGAPSGPWPFLDLDSEIDPVQLAHPQSPSATQLQEADWSKYPQSLYPNWTPAQQEKSGIAKIIQHVPRETCTIHHVNVLKTGVFTSDEDDVVTDETQDEYWKKLQDDLPDEIRLRALFVDKLSGPVLQMLGTRYNVEPFFFSSSLKWIPARYQEAVGEGDHITLTLTFIRTMQNPTTVPPSPRSSYNPSIRTLHSVDQVIDTQAPLILSSSDHLLLPDIIAIHMIRSPKRSTIISYHPPHVHRTTTASMLRTRLLAAGQSVYWNKIFASTIGTDPTFVLLALLWYPLYAFDESLQALYDHICWLEFRVMSTTDMTLTQQLHVVRAHLLHYASLLEDFRKTVVFVAQTPNPVLEHPSDARPPETIAFVTELMRKESTNLLNEISRLEQSRSMQDNRLKNVMNLAFSSVNLEDSRRMRELTEATVRDSAAMKQIAYLTMFFLPASFAASIFGMNVKEINPGTNGTIPYYLALALPLTAVTIWIIMTFRYRRRNLDNPNHDDDHTYNPRWSRFSWPLVALRNLRRKEKGTSRNSKAATFSLNSRPVTAFELNSRPNSPPMSRTTSKALEARNM